MTTTSTASGEVPTGDRRPEDDCPMPDRAKLEAVLATVGWQNGPVEIAALDLIELIEGARFALHVLPPGADFHSMSCRNPLNQVYFRAGLLACREYMARFVEQGGDATTAQSIRANWWPSLGDDPGAPRLFDFAELCDEIEGPDGKPQWKSKDITASVEALPRAYQFLEFGNAATPPPGSPVVTEPNNAEAVVS